MTYRQEAGPSPMLVVSTHVTALDRATGGVLWTYDLCAVARRFSVDDHAIVVLDGSGVVHCIDLGTGKPVGRVDLQLSTPNVLLVDGDRIYVTSDREVVALTRSGQILWRTRIPTNGGHSLGGLAILGGQQMQPDFSHG